MISLTIRGEKELRQAADALRGGKGKLREELTTAFKNAGRDTLRRVKRNVETMQIRGYRTGRKPRFTDKLPGTGIRRRIARVTELEVTTGGADPKVRFIVRADRLGDASEVPYHLDSGKIFRHPIVGNRSSWAGSRGKPWFYEEIKSDRAVFEAECDKAIQRAIERIEKS